MKNKSLMRIIIVVIMIVVIIILAICIKKQFASEPTTPANDVVSEQSGEDAEVELAQIPIDFVSLKEQNPDIYAWISIPDTPVDNPILQSPEGADDDYYLERTVDGKKELPGSIYTQASLNEKDFSDNVTVIYGHNMRDKSFFGSLDEYSKEKYRKQNSTILIYTPEKVYTYELAFAVTYNNKHILYHFDCNDDKAGYQEFLDSLETDSVSPEWITDEFELTTDDQIIILSTCNNNDEQRYLVGAKLVSVQDGEYVAQAAE